MAEDEEKDLKRKREKTYNFEREEEDRYLNELAKYFKRRQLNKFVPFDTYHSKFALYQYYFLCKELVLPPFNDVHYEFLYQIQVNKKKVLTKDQILIPLKELYHIVPTKRAEINELRDAMVEKIMIAERRPEFRDYLPDSFQIHPTVDLIHWFWWLYNTASHVSPTLFNKFSHAFHYHKSSSKRYDYYQLWEKLNEILRKYANLWREKINLYEMRNNIHGKNEKYEVKVQGEDKTEKSEVKNELDKDGIELDEEENNDKNLENPKIQSNIKVMKENNVVDLEDLNPKDNFVYELD
eukprot:Mrub_06792.p1 GENE.Mrub_06792~~Mrub_06792.p1  ORF type:complete len:320 (+),score=48.37 Mrub_06792:77-961(+)